MRLRHLVLVGLLVGVCSAQALADEQAAAPGGSAAPAVSAAPVGSAVPVGSAAPPGSAAPAGSGSAAALPPPPPPAPPAGSSAPGRPPSPPPRAGQPPAGRRPAYPPPGYGRPGYGYGRPGYGYGRPAYPYPPPPGYAPPEPPPPPKPKGVHLHDGFYLRLDLGYGFMHESAHFTGSGADSSQTESGGAFGFSALFGGTPIVGFAVGGGLLVAGAPNPKASGDTSVRSAVKSESLAGLVGFADYFINPKGGFHVLGLVGIGSLSFTEQGASTNSNYQPGGLLVGAGVGYDFWVSDQWSIGVLGRVMYGPLSTSYTPDASGASLHYSSDVVLPALALTALYH